MCVFLASLVSHEKSQNCYCCGARLHSHNQVRGHRTGSSHSGAEEYPRDKTQTKPKVVHAYIIADAIHASARKIIKVKSGVSPRCARSILVHTSHYSRLKKRLHRLPPRKDHHVCVTRGSYHYAYARQTQVKWKTEKKKKRHANPNPSYRAWRVKKH